MCNNALLAKVWNKCNSKSENNINSNKTTAFDILDMPIEIDESPYMFTEEELEYSGVDFLNEEFLVTSSDEMEIPMFNSSSVADSNNLDEVDSKNASTNTSDLVDNAIEIKVVKENKETNQNIQTKNLSLNLTNLG